MEKRSGGCHCGAVRYEATLDLDGVITCNCSHCSKKGFMLKFIPENNFKLLKGEDSLTLYHFNKGTIDHLFCKTCGVESYASAQQGDTKMIAVNVRCLDDIGLNTIKTTEFNGKIL